MLGTSHDGTAVKLDRVSRTYRLGEFDIHAVRDVSLDLADGRFAAIVGPSGSGKTTLLNLIGCIDTPDAGTVTVAGAGMGELDDDALSDFRARHLGFIFQTFNLVPVLSAYENVEQPLTLLGVPLTERRERTLAILEAVGILDQRQHRPNQLSGGQRQRVAIARALVKQPRLVVADEPTANLDATTGASIVELMLRMQREHRMAFVVSSHDPDLVAEADEKYVIRDGALVDHEIHRIT